MRFSTKAIHMDRRLDSMFSPILALMRRMVSGAC